MSRRVEQMYSLYAQGVPLSEVGRRFGLSRQRVHTLFVRAGLGTRSRRDVAALRRRQQLARAGEVLAAYERAGDPSAVAAELGLPRAIVKEIVREALPASRIRRRERLYADDELLTTLAIANDELGGHVSQSAYDALAKRSRLADGRRWPTHQTHAKRFGSWRAALERAGIRSLRGSAGPRTRVIGAAECVGAIQRVERELGHVPSYAEYERAARASRGDLPSASTVRNRHGTWRAALRAAGYGSTDAP